MIRVEFLDKNKVNTTRKKILLAIFGVFKNGDLEYDNRFMAAHIALHEKVLFR